MEMDFKSTDVPKCKWKSFDIQTLRTFRHFNEGLFQIWLQTMKQQLIMLLIVFYQIEGCYLQAKDFWKWRFSLIAAVAKK